MSGAPDIVVIGGGLVGGALAWGFARAGVRVTVVDAGEDRFHASAGNFGLVWVQGKGAAAPAYARLSRRSADGWRAFADTLEDRAGVPEPLGYSACGGLKIALDEAELETMATDLERMRSRPEPTDNGTRLIDAGELRARVPEIGPQAVGASFGPHDGHADPLATLRALHRAVMRAKGRIVRGTATRVRPEAGSRDFSIEVGARRLVAPRVVLAAGLGNVALCRGLGLQARLRPQRGQIVVTERTRRFLPLACHTVRQTGEGTVMLGDSKEDVGFDTGTTPRVAAAILDRAVRCFPRLADLRMVRIWGALRVMSPDGLPIYQASRRHPGATLVSCHSGVTLAAAHSGEVAGAILADRLDELYGAFSPDRFTVSP